MWCAYMKCESDYYSFDLQVQLHSIMQHNRINSNTKDHIKPTYYENTTISIVKQQSKQEDCLKEKTVCLNHSPNKYFKDNAFNRAFITYIPVQIIQTVENNQTRQCRYLLFHLPFTLMLCDTLQIHRNQSDLYLFSILKEQIQIINQLSKRKPLQMSEQQCMKVIMDAINLAKMPKDYYFEELGRFLEKNKTKMSTFIPYYYYLFELVCKRSEYIRQETNLVEVNCVLQAKIKWIREKFHNFDIQ